MTPVCLSRRIRCNVAAGDSPYDGGQLHVGAISVILQLIEKLNVNIIKFYRHTEQQ